MSKHERIARIDGIDLATGVFPMTLATEGEASDGHILSIKGGQIPERMPMLSAHWNEPTSQLGSINQPEKRLKDSPPRLRAMGHIEMSGEGASAEIRRDLAHMIDKGHVTGVSIRWDDVPGKTVRRVNLPSDHPYFVDAETANGPERWGVFFEEWRALEGSVVPIGSDPQALIGRANETTGEVRAFWRSMVDEGDADAARWLRDFAAKRTPTPGIGIDEHLGAGLGGGYSFAPLIPAPLRDVVLLSELSKRAAAAREAGFDTAALINAVIGDSESVVDDADTAELEPYSHEGRTLFLPASLVDLLGMRVDVEDELDTETEPDPDPSPDTPADQQAVTEAPRPQPSRLTLDAGELRPPVDVQAFGEFLRKSMEESDERVRQAVRAIFDASTGRVL